MTQGYTPTDNEIAHYAARGMDTMGICAYDEAKRRWSRWLAAHDAQIRESARHLPLTDKEITAFAKAMFETLGKYGLFDVIYADWKAAFDDAFFNGDNGKFGLEAMYSGINALNAAKGEKR